jgi:hypothetical protein
MNHMYCLLLLDQELNVYPWEELAVHVTPVPLLILIEAFERAGCPLHSRSPTSGGLTLKVTLTITSIIDTISDPVLVTYMQSTALYKTAAKEIMREIISIKSLFIVVLAFALIITLTITNMGSGNQSSI